jgi:heme exporter protein A
MEPDLSSLEVQNVSCTRGDRRIFRDLSFALAPGSGIQLVGTNGSGKTSLLRLICGLMKPEEGEIRWRGQNIHSLGEEYSTEITYVGHRNGLKEELTSTENLRVSSGLAGKVLSREIARDALRRMGLGDRENLPVRFLSEGQRRRAALARLLTCMTSLWLLDEVLTSLDKAAVGLVKAIIEEHLSSGGMAILATHQELDFAAGSFQRIELAS